MNIIKYVAGRYSELVSEQYFYYTTIVSVGFFLASIATTQFVSAYASRIASNPVTDIILSNTPVYNTDGWIVYGALAVAVAIAVLIFLHPKRAPFIFYSLGLLFFIRAFFMSLTHLGLYPLHTEINFQSRLALAMFGGGDEFFSGHVSAPFLMALLFWKDMRLRFSFIFMTFVLGIAVLLGHVHYSIDVAAAFFITYAIYHISRRFFSTEYELFMTTISRHTLWNKKD
ncbi:MAG TPA: hypothetical protein ENJ75_02245 [Candidatus Kaiserbacteria bacterium]|nr:hypothetical protein [Candidatus Kaiserbacteria bacterium]